MPAGCLYEGQTFIDKHPETIQALANAIVRATKWIQAAGASDVVKAVPESHLLRDRAVYIDAFLASKDALSPDGVIPQAGPPTALRALHRTVPCPPSSTNSALRDTVFRVRHRAVGAPAPHA